MISLNSVDEVFALAKIYLFGFVLVVLPIAAALASLLSILIKLRLLHEPKIYLTKLNAARLSCVAVSNKSMVSAILSTAQ